MPPDAGSPAAPARRVNARSRGQEWDAPSTPSFQAQDNQETRPQGRRPGIGRSDARRRSCGFRVPDGWIAGGRCGPSFARQDLGDERRVEPHQRRHDVRLHHTWPPGPSVTTPGPSGASTSPVSPRSGSPRRRPPRRPPRRHRRRRRAQPTTSPSPAASASTSSSSGGSDPPTPRSGSASATPKKAAATPGARVTAAGPTSSSSAPGKIRRCGQRVRRGRPCLPGPDLRQRHQRRGRLELDRLRRLLTARPVRARRTGGRSPPAEEPSAWLGRPRPDCVMLAGPPDRRSCRRPRDCPPRPRRVPAGATPEGDGVVVGDGPVQVDAYIDFLCPFCRRFELSSGPTLAALVTGHRISIAYHPMNFLDQASTTRYSTRAAAASGCAADQARFTDYLHALFVNQPPEGGAGLSDTELTALGRRGRAAARLRLLPDRGAVPGLAAVRHRPRRRRGGQRHPDRPGRRAAVAAEGEAIWLAVDQVSAA